MACRHAVAVAALLAASGVFAQPQWIENADGTMEITIQRVEENSRLLIQMRPIFEELGWNVEWAPLSRTITATQEGYRMTLQIDNRLALVNGNQYYLDVPPRLVYGDTYVPMRFVAEATDCQVDYFVDAVKITDADGTVLIVHLIDD